jgi:hypothetical protein
MPKKDDEFTVTLKKAHIEWGTHRHTSTRGLTYGEGYIQISSKVATSFDIYMSNKIGANTEYTCNSSDGTLKNVILKASGSQGQNLEYAKQFQGSGNLKALGDWYHAINAQIGDEIKVLFTSPTDITLNKV